MKQLLPRSCLILTAWHARLTGQIHATLHRCTDSDGERGANVVETIIIVAGFAILAAAIYTAVSGKVHTWMAKIP